MTRLVFALAVCLSQIALARQFDVEVSCARPNEWTIEKTVTEPEPDVTLVRLRLRRSAKAEPPAFRVSWTVPQLDIAHVWTPRADRATVPPDWSQPFVSGIARGMPLMALINGMDGNRLTFGCSETTRTLRFHAGLNEETCTFRCFAEFFTAPEAPLTDYQAEIRLDGRRIPWFEAVSSTASWMSSGGRRPCEPPPAAYEPVYSTWYGFHQAVSADAIERECALAAPLGMKTLITDAFCGDWNVSPKRIPDMWRHVAAIHALGMKYMLWYSVPFVGEKSANFERFRGKYLYHNEGLGASVLDPRFPEVRAFLSDVYERAMREWNLDGFKLDFIDSFGIPSTGDPAVAENYTGRDLKSVPEAVRVLLDDITRRLRTIKPEVLIEFRQNYYGPQIRRYGNMIRAADCPGDIQANLMRTVALRLTCPGSSVHSDMLEWHADESAESAAREILACLFSTVQYSRLLGTMKPEHLRMMTHWMSFMREHRAALLFGKLRPHHPEANYPFVEAEGTNETVVAVYTAGTVVPLRPGRRTYVVNATGAGEVVVDAAAACACETFDTFGLPCGTVTLASGLSRVTIPVSGYARVSFTPALSAVSPDGANEIRIYQNPLSYEVLRCGKIVVARSDIGLEIDDGWLKPTSEPAVTRLVKSGWVLTPVYRKSAVDLSGSEAYADFGGWGVRLMARNDGVAYRLELTRDRRMRIRNEQAEVVLPDGDGRCWVNYSGAFGMEESVVQSVQAGDILTNPDEPRKNWSGRRFVSLPLVYEVGTTAVAVTESGVRDYPVWNLTRDVQTDAVRLRSLFAGWPKSEMHCEASPTNWLDRIRLEKGGRWVQVLEHEDYLVETDGPRVLPWRTFVLADRLSSLCEADIVRVLGDSCGREEDFSWVKPGLAAWDWWNCFDNLGEVGCATVTYRRFIDFAARWKIPYVILDEGWCRNLDIQCANPAVDVRQLVAYARQCGVGLVFWLSWAQAYGREEETAAHFAELGAKGLKVDFMDRGDAKALRFLETFAAACARHRLIVDYHGVCRPVGLEARYPNILNYEAVHGLEKMKWCEERGCDFMANDVREFFVRMTAGPMDYTPGAMLNFARGTYRHDGRHPGSYGTRCRQMALLVLYEAPLQMLCDSPTNYEANGECLSFMAGVPTVWRRTCGLGGDPESHALVARESADGVWYAAGITNWEGRTVDLDTGFLDGGRWQVESFYDLPDGATNPRGYRHGTLTMAAGERIPVVLAPGGGFVMRFTRLCE